MSKLTFKYIYSKNHLEYKTFYLLYYVNPTVEVSK